jgi:hypothetical protein
MSRPTTLLGLVAALAVPFLAAPVSAQEEIVSEVSGNWAAPANGGFYYRAVLAIEKKDGVYTDFARLRIYQGMQPSPGDDALQLDNPAFGFRLIGVGEQRLEVAEDGALIVILDGADETSEFLARRVIRFIDNQFTVVGEYRRWAEEGRVYECDLDVWNAEAVVNGARHEVGAIAFEDKNAALWSDRTAFERGWCPQPF